MFMNFLKKGLFACLALASGSIGMSDLMAADYYDISKYINIDINSGNPAFPFPQFLEYKEGKTLAKYNAEGVTHADMEKTMREAYQIMSHRCQYEGGTHCGVPYITYNNFEYSFFTSESDGHMLLASAIFADQPTFNGLWMWIHDNRLSNVKKYSDGEWLRKASEKDGRMVFVDSESGLLVGYNCTGDDDKTNAESDARADFDIAMALLIAYKQWGEYMYQDGKQVKDALGAPISYKKEAQTLIKAIVDTVPHYAYEADGLFLGYLSGDIGFDGYTKTGDRFGETTLWAYQNNLHKYGDLAPSSALGGGISQYAGDAAPSYFTEFAKWLEEGDGDGTEWQINQYKRAAASSQWIAGQLYDQGGIASVGRYVITDDNKVEFAEYNGNDDFIFAWRHILAYLWHGNPTTTWNPETHTVDKVGNTFEHDLAIRHAEFMKRPLFKYRGDVVDCGPAEGYAFNSSSLNWFGPSQICQSYLMNGEPQDGILSTNYALGCSGPSVVALGDEELLGDIFRECELRFRTENTDPETDDEKYINSIPVADQGWFRTLGMLVTSGNLSAPSEMKPSANVKVYMSVDKTVAYKGDKVTYDVQCRNYGSTDANDAVITTKLDPDYEFVSATKGGTYNVANNTITWKIGSIPGFKTGSLASTMDTVSFTVRVKDTENKLVGLTSTISGSNFEKWESNAYPNNATYTMESNLVDILDAPLTIEKSFGATEASVNDTVEYTLKIVSDKRTMLNGGRENVRLTYGNYLVDGGSDLYQYYRLYHDASEAYINMGDYRVSYFINDTCGAYSEENKEGFELFFDNKVYAQSYGFSENGEDLDFLVEEIAPGEDENGKWNKRLILRFPNILSATTSHLEGTGSRLANFEAHKGPYVPPFFITRFNQLYPVTETMNDRVSDDWSYSDKAVVKAMSGDMDVYSLVSPGWYDRESLGDELTEYARYSCDEVAKSYDRVLVEQWDGYTWRRIQGTAPDYGRILKNAVLVDTLPKELEIIAQPNSLGVFVDKDGKINVEIPELISGDTLVYKFLCKVVAKPNSGVINAPVASLSTDGYFATSNPLAITVKEPTDVKNVKIFNQNELVDVYSTNGALLRKQVEFKDALIGLQSGVYMVNGVKIIVK